LSKITILEAFYLFDKSPVICAALIANAITRDLIIYFASNFCYGIFDNFPKLLANSFYGIPIDDESFP